ncbi:hypothetical protein B4U79_17644 [Dinothrombium tinctorium]|uniref:DNA/RNA-binding domain-containing protein n=1 Tax=Dinothrombium tinctorium TaxID=1965070 RepID=A0A443R4E8_9ACAR|nr:hypothetical protein B4U79_17644 [Dinothrombium tinctorium]
MSQSAVRRLPTKMSFGEKERNTILTNCSVICNNTYRLIVANLKRNNSSDVGNGNNELDNASNDNAANSVHKLEAKLWCEVMKFKDTNDLNVISFLHGFYVTLLQTVNLLINSRKCDPYFILSSSLSTRTANKCEHILLYNILIRLGDLNRYLRNQSMAKLYYSQARDLNPQRGHAYNQLALIAINDGIKSIYYYVRAFLASEEPFTMAENNLKSAVTRFSITIPAIKALFDRSQDSFDLTSINNLLYIAVIAIYAENVKFILKPLILETLNWLRLQTIKSPPSSPSSSGKEIRFTFLNSTDSKCLLPSLLTLMDYLLTQQQQGSNDVNLNDCESIVSELKCETDLFLSQNADLIALQADRSKALKHDYILLGFSPLKQVHEQLKFDENPQETKNQHVILISRISEKIDKLLAIIKEKKQETKSKKSRNIALQSILSNK